MHSFFGLDTPTLLDLLALGLLVYAGALAFAHRQPITRQALMAFTVADALWVVASAIVLLLFWGQLAAVARLMILAVALVVEVFATLQFRAAGRGLPRFAASRLSESAWEEQIRIQESISDARARGCNRRQPHWLSP